MNRTRATFLPGQFAAAVQPVRPVAAGGGAQPKKASLPRPRNTSAPPVPAEETDIDYNHMAPKSGSAEPTMIQRDTLELGKELGSGEFGEVFKGTWRKVCCNSMYVLFYGL